jgi:hypothetical protein
VVHRAAGFSIAGRVFTAFYKEYRVFQAIFRGKSGQLQRNLQPGWAGGRRASEGF